MRPESNDSEKLPLRERPVGEIAATLQATLGQQMTAYAIHEHDPRQIGVYARGEAVPEEQAEAVLRDMGEITETLLEKRMSARAIQALMLGSNPGFDGECPIQLIHEGASARVANAAKDFLSGYR